MKWCNIIRYYISNYRNWGRISIRWWIYKSTTYLVLFVRKLHNVIMALHCISYVISYLFNMFSGVCFKCLIRYCPLLRRIKIQLAGLYSRVLLLQGPIYDDDTIGTVMTAAECKSDFKLTTDVPCLALMGKLWGVCCDDLGEKLPRYNGTAPYDVFLNIIICPHCFQATHDNTYRSGQNTLC